MKDMVTPNIAPDKDPTKPISSNLVVSKAIIDSKKQVIGTILPETPPHLSTNQFRIPMNINGKLGNTYLGLEEEDE